MSRTPRVLIVDDEPLFLETLQRIFRREGMEVYTASSGEGALAILEAKTVDVALVDVVMPNMGGVEFLRRARSNANPPEVVMLTAHATVETAVEAMKLGAYDYLQKPADVNDVERVLRKAYEKLLLSRENVRLKRRLRRHDPYQKLVGSSAPMAELTQMIERVGPSDSTVLILGESGVGKELVARQLHASSARSRSEFMTVNCASLRASLLENELFGHVEGAFTGATKRSLGLFEESNGGTLLIDEIGEMQLEVQAALLRVLETGEFKRLGEARSRRTDVRLIAATNRDLERDVEAGRFRQDLFYRLNVISITAPPLREHIDDLPELVEYFLRLLEPHRDPPRQLTAAAMKHLQGHRWPGNVRELRNALERGLILSRGDQIDVRHLPPPSFAARTAPASRAAGASILEQEQEITSLAELERRQISLALARTEGNKTAAAKILGISVRSLYTRIRKLDIRGDTFAPDR